LWITIPCRLAGGLPTCLRNPLPAFFRHLAEADIFEILGGRRHFCTALKPEESVKILVVLKTSIFIVSENISAF
jgi:hypothetical protein